ncbi:MULTISPECIES: hypothetical protein [unclassified Nostoc]|nr:hypothetical protein [Nostoc sp. KVJ20]
MEFWLQEEDSSHTESKRGKRSLVYILIASAKKRNEIFKQIKRTFLLEV